MSEYDDLSGGGAAESGPTIDFRGGPAASVIPIGFFILWAIFQSGVLGVGDTSGLIIGMLVGLILGLFFVKGDWKSYADVIFEGMTQRVAATAIVAWLWAGMFAETIQVGGFVDGLVWAAQAASVGADLFPALTFLLAALLATGIGTGYGTAITFTTLVFPAGLLIGANPVLLFGAILSGAVFGDNLAPVSDTTIVSAVTQDADIGGVVASRLKYALVAAVFAFAAYLLAGELMDGGFAVTGTVAEQVSPLGLIHLIDIAIVIVLAVRGRHIVEAISWGLIAAAAFNVLLGNLTFLTGGRLDSLDVSVGDMILFQAPEGPLVDSIAGAPVIGAVVTSVDPADAAVGGSLYDGAVGFFPLIVLTLLIVAAARIMQRGGGFDAIQTWLLDTVATTIRRAETTMVLGTALVNATITINTAAEIAIAPYIRTVGRRFNINGYRRANILDANTSALGYIFPWGGGLLAGYQAMQSLPGEYPWLTEGMLVNPASVWPYVFHGWFLVAVFLLAAWTGYGLEYISDRKSGEVSRV